MLIYFNWLTNIHKLTLTYCLWNFKNAQTKTMTKLPSIYCNDCLPFNWQFLFYSVSSFDPFSQLFRSKCYTIVFEMLLKQNSKFALKIELVTQILHADLFNQCSKILQSISNPLRRLRGLAVHSDHVKISKLLYVGLEKRRYKETKIYIC